MRPVKVLVLQLGGIGDVIMTLPLVQRLRNLLGPSSRIHLYLSDRAEGLAPCILGADEISFGGAPWLDPDPMKIRWDAEKAWVEWLFGKRFPPRVLRDYVRAMRRDGPFHYAFDVRGDWRHGFMLWRAGIPVRIQGNRFGHVWPWATETVRRVDGEHEADAAFRLADGVAIALEDQYRPATAPLLKVPKGALASATAKLKRARKILRVPPALPLYVMPNGGTPDKLWPEQSWAEVLRRLPARWTPVLLGEEKDSLANACLLSASHTLHTGINMAGCLTIAETVALFAERKGAYVGVDTGLSHMAALLGMKTVTAHAAVNDVRRWGVRGPRACALVDPEPGAVLDALFGGIA